MPCDQGTYKPTVGNEDCTFCPDGLATLGEGAAHLSACNGARARVPLHCCLYLFLSRTPFLPSSFLCRPPPDCTPSLSWPPPQHKHTRIHMQSRSPAMSTQWTRAAPSSPPTATPPATRPAAPPLIRRRAPPCRACRARPAPRPNRRARRPRRSASRRPAGAGTRRRALPRLVRSAPSRRRRGAPRAPCAARAT